MILGISSGSPLTFSISLKSSSSLVPSAPPTFSLTSCGERTRGEDQALIEPSPLMEKFPGREKRAQGWSTQHLPEKGGGRNSQKDPPNSPEHPKLGSARMFLTHQQLHSSPKSQPTAPTVPAAQNKQHKRLSALSGAKDSVSHTAKSKLNRE